MRFVADHDVDDSDPADDWRGPTDEQMDETHDLCMVLEAVLASDMAMREEDEGRESATLNLVRAALAKARGEESR